MFVRKIRAFSWTHVKGESQGMHRRPFRLQPKFEHRDHTKWRKWWCLDFHFESISEAVSLRNHQKAISRSKNESYSIFHGIYSQTGVSGRHRADVSAWPLEERHGAAAWLHYNWCKKPSCLSGLIAIALRKIYIFLRFLRSLCENLHFPIVFAIALRKPTFSDGFCDRSSKNLHFPKVFAIAMRKA